MTSKPGSPADATRPTQLTSPGDRVFGMRFTSTPRGPVSPGGRHVCVEVTDTRAERLPVCPTTPDAERPRESGRGLLLVSELATRWDWHTRRDGPGKTVRAEYAPGER